MTYLTFCNFVASAGEYEVLTTDITAQAKHSVDIK